MRGALQNLMWGLESIHGGLKSVLKNMGWEGLHSLVKLAAIKKKKNFMAPFYGWDSTA